MSTSISHAPPDISPVAGSAQLAAPELVAVDDAAAVSEQKVADTFAELKLIPGKVVFKDFVDTRFNGNLPPSTTAPRSYGKDS